METRLLAVWLLILLWGIERGESLTCRCLHPPQVVREDCAANNDTCSSPSTSVCIFRRTLITAGNEQREDLTWDCLGTIGDSGHGELFCQTMTDEVRVACCRGPDLCNDGLENQVPPIITTTPPIIVVPPISGGLTEDGGNPQSAVYRRVTILVPICSALLIVLIIVITPSLVYFLRVRKRRIERLRSECHMRNGREPSPDYSPYSLDTLDNLDLEDQTCTSGSGSGAPLLTQRTIARCIRVGEPIGSGRFGQVFVGDYMGDKVAVKKFASRDEKSWFRETEVYNTVLLRHDNILGYMASDVFSNIGVTELWLVTQFHPHGSLFDYLNQQTISPRVMMKMAITMCKGLTHLHTEVMGTSAKPAIAHRDIKSKNILVKNNLEVCIADFGLAVMKGSSSSIVNFPTNPKQGTKRYMAPEILSETINMKRIDDFQKADIYAFGLVLWEMCKRCAHKNDSIGDYEPPFHGKVGADPTFEEMRKVVVLDRQQPTIPAHWHSDDLLESMSSVMRECWYFNANARNNALFYKLKLIELAREDKIDYDVQE